MLLVVAGGGGGGVGVGPPPKISAKSNKSELGAGALEEDGVFAKASRLLLGLVLSVLIL